MDLELTPADLAFRDEVRDFLREKLTPELRRAGERATSVFAHPCHSLPWQRILHARGWAAPSWPAAHGGPGWTEVQRHIFAAECARAGAPSLAPMGLRMAGPVIMGHGTPAQKAHYLPRILSGEDYWCQGYSEPGAGSDLAALQLRADSDGEDYVLNGSKIWTTHAQFANRMFCLVRTALDGKPQQGVTFLLLEMDSPGIEVKPIVTLAGEHDVNQVFFGDVRVPKANRLGEENQGWTVAKYLLEFERGGSSAPRLQVATARARALADAERLDDPAWRRRAAEAEIAVQAVDISERRVLSALEGGSVPGPAASILKINGAETLQRIDELALDAAGAYAAVDQPRAREPDADVAAVGPEHSLTVMARYLNDRAASIYGGSNEIQRDIIARLVLGL